MFNGHVVLHYRKTWESAVWMDLCVLNCFTSVQFSRSVVSDSLWPHGLQHARPPCPSWTPRACSNSCPSSQWCHPTISSSVVPFSSCLQSFPASRSFPVSQFFASGGQSIRASHNPMDCSLPGSSLHGILQARVLEWVAISFSRGSSWPRDPTLVFCIPGRHFNLSHQGRIALLQSFSLHDFR